MENLFTRNFSEFVLKSINEVAEEVQVEPYILRFWESKFSQISPTKSKGNRRLYSRSDVETLKEIKRLLYDEGFTIEGAKKHLNEAVIIASRSADSDSFIREIDEIIAELLSLKQELASDEA